MKEESIEQIKEIFLKFCEGIANDKYTVAHESPENVGSNIIECKNEQTSEGKNVAYILKEGAIVALVGYKS